ARLVPLTGESQDAGLMGCRTDGTFLFQVEGDQLEQAADNFLRWGQRSKKPQPGPRVYLAGGSCLISDPQVKLKIADDTVTFESVSLGSIALKVDLISGILLEVPDNSALCEQSSDRIRNAKGTTDTIILDNGDQVQGILIELNDENFKLQTSAGNIIEDDRSKVQAIVFNPALVEKLPKQNSQMFVHLADGSFVIATKWSGSEDRFQMKTADGTELSSPYQRIRRNRPATPVVIGLQPFVSQVTYLSDMKPAAYRHRPYLSVRWPYQLDRNVKGEALSCRGQVYDKGIGMHSTASLSFQLKKPYQRFDASLAIDEATEGKGSVVFRVYINDGSGEWQQRYKSKVIRGSDESPTNMSVDITGAKSLSLVVDAADRGDELDHANWLDARLVPAGP
ncbi:MAG: NPCBM/NEW2 domain-containing protein, partial [Planctomycetales bacterium]